MSWWGVVIRSPIGRGVALLLAASGLITLGARGAALMERPPRAFLSVLALALRNAQRVQTTRMAAALAYRTIFSVIPVLVVGLAVMGGFAKDEQIRDAVKQLMAFTGLTQITVEAPATAVGEPDGAPAGAGELPPAAQPQSVEAWITGLIDNFRKIPFGAIGIIGIGALVYAAISMLVEVEQAFNHVCRAPTGRSWARRVTQYWAMLTLGPIFLVGSFYAGEEFRSLVRKLTEVGALTGVGEVLVIAAGYLATVVISTGLLLIVYMTMPNTRVRIGPALAGAVFAAVLWEAGKWGFTRYLHYSTSYSRLYGSIALIPLFMLWVYVTWVIVLVGLQVAHAMHTYGVTRERGLKIDLFRLGVLESDEAAGPRIVDPAAVVPVAAAVARAFRHGAAAERGRIANAVGIDERVATDLLERLAEAGFVHRVQNADGDGYALARPPEQIAVNDLLAAALALTMNDPKARGPEREALVRLERLRVDAVRDRSLADFLPPEPAPGSRPDATGAGAATIASPDGSAAKSPVPAPGG